MSASVELFYYAATALRLAGHGRFTTQILLGSAAGILGSLWWWASIGPWYFSVLQGAIWGTFVGTAASSVRPRSVADAVA